MGLDETTESGVAGGVRGEQLVERNSTLTRSLARRLFHNVMPFTVSGIARRTTIACGGQQEVDGVSLLINRAIPIPVLAADLDVRLVQSPAFADRTDASFALPFPKGFLQPEPA